ncbi:MAG: hypothetical protein KDC98_19820, partial [Planctomycetes bacterium]|nr:hypothetical protein [Planctomycetota bacterium]
VKGGTLVIFADAADYTIGQRRQFTKSTMLIDAAASEVNFHEQLRHYGIDWKPKLLADAMQDAYRPRNMAQPQEYLAVTEQTLFGQRPMAKTYPYFFHAVNRDWSAVADQLARDPATGEIDKVAADSYRHFLPGMPSDEFLFTSFKEKAGRGPGFYWPTWVGLREKAGGEADLPEGVAGKVLLWSSPLTLVEDPPQSLDPFGYGDAQARDQAYRKFVGKLNERLTAEPRQQAPLMAEVRGTFTSFFQNRERPLRPSELKEAEAKKAAAAANGEQNGDEQAAKEDADKPPAEPIGPEPPPAADGSTGESPTEADKVTRGERKGRIVIVGDSDFIRDDFVSGNYAQMGGPYSVLGGAFFSNMLDWLAEDSDLVALQSRVPTDRTMKFVEDAPPGTDPRAVEQALSSKTSALRLLNILLPIVLLAVFGLLVFLLRRAQKRSFLESMA